MYAYEQDFKHIKQALEALSYKEMRSSLSKRYKLEILISDLIFFSNIYLEDIEKVSSYLADLFYNHEISSADDLIDSKVLKKINIDTETGEYLYSTIKKELDSSIFY
jgi:hypothetical protein